MLYAILSYDAEANVDGWTHAEQEAQMGRFRPLERELTAQGRMGPCARLGPSASARTYRPADALVTDGPFAETKEQLLGLYIVECDSSDDALALARRLQHGSGSFEVRPIDAYYPATITATIAKSGARRSEEVR